MITPKFTLDQTENKLMISVHAPYTNIRNTEIHVFENDFRFYSAPYYLRLELPGAVQEGDDSSAKYDADEGKFLITLDKMVAGEHFPLLEMLTSLKKPKEEKNLGKPLITVVDDSSSIPLFHEQMDDDDWSIEQNFQDDQPSASSALLNQYQYGFGNRHKGLWTKYEVELGEVSEIQNPDSIPPNERRKMKLEMETEKFDDDHYLNDLLMESEIPRLLQFPFDSSSLQKLCQENQEVMANLGNRQFLLDKKEAQVAYLGLVDILYGYCYDWRSNEGAHSIESPWNISKLSGTLSWFVTFDNIKEVAISSYRRSLSYPLLRSWELSTKVFEDVAQVLNSGPIGVLICLLDIKNMFGHRDPYYLLNQLYIDDYCIWIQKSTTSNLASLANSLGNVLGEISKGDVALDLVELELAAKLVEDEEMEEELAENIGNINI